MKKVILHIDMDAFYAAIEQRDNPAFKNKPLCVGAIPPERGVVSTCSYEARKFGVHSAMPVSIAKKLCPDAIFIKPRISKYIEVSNQIFNILSNYSDKILKVSIDEAYLDITGMVPYYLSYEYIGESIKKEIYEKTKLKCSIGIAHCKLIAKIASDFDKPDGFVIVEDDIEFLENIDLKNIPGFGEKTVKVLNQFGIKKFKDLLKSDINKLKSLIGNHIEYFFFKRFLFDDHFEHSARNPTISTETTFEKDIYFSEELKSLIYEMCYSLAIRLLKNNSKTNTITVKLRNQDFRTYQKQKKLDTLFYNPDEIFKISLMLIKELIKTKLKGDKIRLLGIKVNMVKINDNELFKINSKQDIIFEKIVRINEKYNSNIIKKGYLNFKKNQNWEI